MQRRKPIRKLIAALVAGVVLATASPALAAQPGIKGGKFEVTCAYSNSAQVDPIVSPGVDVSAHLHDFFGNKNVTKDSTPDQLVGLSTTCKLSQDTAAYWVPAAYRTDTGAKVQPVKVFAYYFGTPGVPTEHIPAGLELVAGDSHATSEPTNKTVISFSCGNGGHSHSPVRTHPYNCLTEPNVVSQGVVAIVKFPYCWDGTGLRPGDVVFGNSQGVCPAGFGHRLPQLQEHVHYGSSVSNPGFQRGDLLAFSSGPSYTFHADYMQAWNQPKLDALVDGCTAIFKDCGFLTNSRPGPGVKGAFFDATYQRRIRMQINRYRMGHGLSRLRIGYRLAAAAREHSRSMAASNALAHGSWLSRIRSHGVRALQVGEILAELPGSPRMTLQAWLASPEHRQILSFRSFKRLGVGVVRARGMWWVTVDFGSGAPS